MADNLTAATNGPIQIDPSAFASLKAELRHAIIAKDSAVAKLRSIRKRMEESGCDLKALDLQMRLERLDDDVREIMLRNATRYAAWSGKPLSTQGSLFGVDDAGGPAQRAQDELSGAEAYEAGYRAAQRGSSASDAPYPAGSFLHERWSSGWAMGKQVMDDVAAGRQPREQRMGGRKPGRRSQRLEQAA